ncbi:hypothetical protein D3C81_1583420 [compost metagenome]
MQDPVYCLIEQHFRLILFQDSLLWWHASFKCEALKQLAANAVDGAYPGLPHRGRQANLTFFKQMAAYSLTKFGRRFSCEGGGNNACRLDLLTEQFLVQNLCEPVSFSAAGACADKSDVRVLRHCHCSHPARAR